MHQRERWDAIYAKAPERHLTDAQWMEPYLARMPSIPSINAVDLGCGEGSHAAWLHARGYTVTACDFSQAALDTVRARYPEIPTLCLDLLDPFPWADASYGLVLASLSTHYFDARQTHALYGRVAHLLLPGGYFLLRVNNRRALQETDWGDVQSVLEEDYVELTDGSRKHYFTPDTLLALLRDTGWATLALAEKTVTYHGHEKHLIEALAQKK